MAIELLIENPLATQVNIDDIADAHNYTGFELVLDADGNPAPELDENDNPVRDENNAIVYQKVLLTKTEFVQKLSLKYILPMLYATTQYLQRENGVLNYNADYFDNLFKATTTAELTVT
jgi:hypothetical protein